jgi:anti-sigma factor RsiW
MGECRRTVEQLAPYLDGELSHAERADVERHLGGCPPCRRAATAASGGRAVLRERSTTLRAAPLPPGLRSRCEALVSQGAGTKSWRQRWLPALAVAALVITTGLGVLSLETRRSGAVLAAQLTADHVKCDHFFTSPDMMPMDARDAELLFSNDYGWEVPVPPSSPADGITLVAARRCLYTSGTIPHMIYRVGGQDMSLFMLPGVTRKTEDIVQLGYESQIWSRGGNTYVLVHRRGGNTMTAVRYLKQRTQ